MRLLLSLLLVLGLVSASACSAPSGSALQVETVTLPITGMTCPVECPPKVQLALASVPGVEHVAVDFNARTATVSGRRIDRRALAEAVARAGFGVGGE